LATVIYTNSLKSGQAVVWSGIMNFIGALVGVAIGNALLLRDEAARPAQ
jgi:PiT family inorganic phosphate transporter